MVPRLRKWYAKRIVNVNVNILVAGMLAATLTTIPVHLTRYLDIHKAWAIMCVSIGADLIFDVVIYYVLHWLANHTPWRRRLRAVKSLKCEACGFDLAGLIPDEHGCIPCPKCSAACNITLLEAVTPKLSFFRDASLVQFERLILSPILYFIVVAVTYGSLKWFGSGRREIATLLGFACGLLVTRTLHPIWMISRGRIDD
ncbi:MAG: hypothetical protein H7Y88_02635 [Phycisphaerales bacterium]|nr:hypothetical protein [Phycisphaerales bacterium]